MSDGIPGDPNADTSTDTWQLKMVGNYPYLFNPSTGALMPAPSGYSATNPSQYNFLSGIQSMFPGNTAIPRIANSLLQPSYDWNQMPGFADLLGGASGGSAQPYMSYDPFTQQLQAAQLQESIRQANLAAGFDRAQYLQSVLSTPSNVFSSFFTARGQVPPYNSQLANILNIPGQGQPFFGSLPPLGETPSSPAIPSPVPPQAIPYASGGTYIPAEPAVAIGLKSGNPLFTFNEQAPAHTESVKITPNKVPSFQGGGTAVPLTEPLPGLPGPLQDVYSRNFPQFPYLSNLGQGVGPGLPQMGLGTQGFPLPSMQSLNRLMPSELASLGDYFNTVAGVPWADVLWNAQMPYRNLRAATPALQLRP